SSVNRLFFMTSFSPLEAILSSFNWSENSRAGHLAQRLRFTVSKSERHWVPTHTFRREGRSAPLGAIIGMSSMLASP
ncbi:hypothetical protein, partial [Burkholderia pseudomallei]|uniref:hypothetical protein n=1 Tax=Burkholderia pseudomallei TaxID=28450 RepID=UPI001C82B9E2